MDKSKSELHFFILACNAIIRLNNFGRGNDIYKNQNDIHNFLLVFFYEIVSVRQVQSNTAPGVSLDKLRFSPSIILIQINDLFV